MTGSETSSRRARALLACAVAALVVAGGTAACGGTPDGDRVQLRIRLSTRGNDISFDQTTVQVPYGVDVRIEFDNQADHDSQIYHNVAILRPGSTDEVIRRLRHAGYDLDQMKGDPDILAITATLLPGESDAVSFRPETPEYYPFICLMPGHGDVLDMRGVIRVAE